MSNIGWGSQGMVMSVWSDVMVFERYDFVNFEKLGDDWVVPILRDATSRREFSFENRRVKTAAPEFPNGAKLKVTARTGKNPQKQDEAQLVVSFPAATGKGASRVFDYEVCAQHIESDIVKTMCTKRVWQPGVQFAPNREAKTVECVFGTCELPTGKFRFAVTPFNSLGVCGKTLFLDYKL